MFMSDDRHRRAAFPRAALHALLVVICLAVVGWAVYGLILFSLRDPTEVKWRSMTTKDLQAIRAAASEYVVDHGAAPAHMVLLAAEGYLDPLQFLNADSTLDPSEQCFGPWAYEELEGCALDQAQIDSFVEAAVDAPEWHLVGDYLISRRITQLEAMDRDLVAIVSIPSPRTGRRLVMLADGTVVTRKDEGRWISDQNSLRSKLNLDPLPVLP